LPQVGTARYLDAVDPGQDDFPELSRLLSGAKERYHSAHATITHTVDEAVAEESKRRFVDWRFEQPGGSGMGILRTEQERRAHGTVSWGYPPQIFHGFYAPEGTTDHLLLVDEAVGTILRVAARLEGREFYVAEATEIAYDEKFSEDTFRLEMPGVEFRR
jgi:hypothetical protein